jgi:putative CocE/NonD family hydrolase
MPRRLSAPLLAAALALLLTTGAAAQRVDPDSLFIREHYTKVEQMVPMRDGVRLFTSIYLPKDRSQPVPILLQRTPYGVGPYGPDAYKTRIAPTPAMARDGYIVVYQDVRGKMMSEGVFEAVRPHNPAKGPRDIDESTDAYDTVAWLLANLDGHNGRVGVWGISAPGFYATHALIDAHPAVRAVSPQAPVTDWWIGDDRHHNGAFQLQASFSFLSSYGAPRPAPSPSGTPGFRAYGTPDGYRWYLEQGPVANLTRLIGDENKIWRDIMAHETYDAFWQARTPLPHLRGVAPAVLVVGGFFDAQDLYGPLKTYQAIEQHNPGATNYLVMGPWWHGGWSRGLGDRYGDLWFGQPTALQYQEQIERAFFTAHLRGDGNAGLPEASIFITGSNEWAAFDAWPPRQAARRNLYLQPGGGLGFEMPTGAADAAAYVSDPARPVPNTPQVVVTRDDRYLIQDQRYASTRPDVLVFETPVLEEDLTVAGDLFAHLFVSTTGTDADYIVKLIDVYPGTARCELPEGGCSVPMGGFQQMVRGEVMRAKFRDSFEHPTPLVPGEITRVRFDMQDVAHTFRRGHRMMVQIHSTWFPMVDLNPQQFLNIRTATEADFRVATHRVHLSASYPSHLEMRVLE